MRLTDFNQKITAKSLNEGLEKQYGQRIAVEKYTLEQLQDARNNLRTQLRDIETNESFNAVDGPVYQKTKSFLDVLNAEISEREHIEEKKAKPDYIDIDGDGDKKEPMKKAVKDKKKKKVGEGQDENVKAKIASLKPEEIEQILKRELGDDDVNRYPDGSVIGPTGDPDGGSASKESQMEGDNIYHSCVTSFKHQKFGEGTVLSGEHTLAEDGTVSHYDASFVKEDGTKIIVRNIPVANMYETVVVEHGHAPKKKKKKNESEEQVDELAPMAVIGGAMAGYAVGDAAYTIYKAIRQYGKDGDEAKLALAIGKEAALLVAAGGLYKGIAAAGRFLFKKGGKAAAKDAGKGLGVGTAGSAGYVGADVASDPEMGIVGQKESVASSIANALMEGEEEKAALVMASKDMVDKVTSWMEDTAEMQTESMLELGDKIRDEVDSATSEQFINTVKPALEALFTALETARGSLNSGVAIVTGEGDDMMGSDMSGTDDIGMDDAGDDMDMDMEPTVDNDEFGADAASAGGEEEAGREKRESVERSRRLGTILSKKK